MLRWRLLLGTLIIAVLIGLCWLDCGVTVPGIWLLPVAIAAALLATKEMLDLLAAAGMKPARWLVYLANFVVVVGALDRAGVGRAEREAHGYCYRPLPGQRWSSPDIAGSDSLCVRVRDASLSRCCGIANREA